MQQQYNLDIIIFILMLVSGFIIYFMYFNISDPFTTTESFTTTQPETTTQPDTPTPIPTIIDNLCKPENIKLNNKSIMSRYFGVGFNIEYFEEMDVYLIHHIPTISTGTLGGCYAISDDNLLTIRTKNRADNTQLWEIIEHTDTVSKYYVIFPLNRDDFALQYENGNLALRPYNTTNNFENQKWLINDKQIKRGIPVLNYSPGSLFTPEFDPYSTPSTYSNNITEQNTQQINEVVNSIKSGIHQYLGKLDTTFQTEEVNHNLTLGQKELPLNINLNLSTNKNQISGFKDINNDTTINSNVSHEMLEIMDRYGPSNTQNSQYKELYRKTDLENELNKYQGCKLLNINDYTSNRVGSCNCKI